MSAQGSPRVRRIALAILVFLAVPVLAQVITLLIMIPFALWIGPQLESRGYLADAGRIRVGAMTIRAFAIVTAAGIGWWVWRSRLTLR